MVYINKITDAYANVVTGDGQELHVAAKPSTLNLLSALAKKVPIETFFDTHVETDKVSTASREKEAIFRLGQLDMQASICDMLRELANGAADPVSAGMLLAADLVETMEVPYANN